MSDLHLRVAERRAVLAGGDLQPAIKQAFRHGLIDKQQAIACEGMRLLPSYFDTQRVLALRRRRSNGSLSPWHVVLGVRRHSGSTVRLWLDYACGIGAYLRADMMPRLASRAPVERFCRLCARAPGWPQDSASVAALCVQLAAARGGVWPKVVRDMPEPVTMPLFP